MRIVVCPSCEKKIKVPDNFTKTSVKCPGCDQPLKLSAPASAPPKQKRAKEELVEDEFDEDFVDEEPEDELFEPEERRSRSSGRSTRGGKRPASRPKKGKSSSTLWIGLGAGGGVLVLAVILVVVLNRGNNVPNNAAPNDVAQQQPAANGTNPTMPANPVAPNADQTAPAAVTPSVPVATTPAVPAQPLPTNAATPQPAPAPVNPAVPVIAANPNNALRYKWEPNREYPYKFSIEANLGEAIERTDGVCIYKISTALAGPTVEFRQKGTGSAFVVTADGYLVTCAHCVDGARTLEVHLGNQTYPAQVISSDAAHDVAVIKINAQNLVPIALSDSDTVQLGQAVRAFGFPLSDVLGNNLKVTVGSVSGLNQQAGGRVFQVDAAVNPGNSGGPLVNDFGDVIGVTSAKLTGNGVSTVGFGRPINDAKVLLQQAGAKFIASAAAQQKLDGVALAGKVSPSVALVHITAGASANRTTLAFEAAFTTTQRAAPGKSMRLSIPNTVRSTGQIVLDEFGEVVSMTGEEQLPMLMGSVGLVALVPLNAGGQASWNRKSPTSITRIEQDPNDPLARLRSRGIRRPFGPPAAAPKGVVFPAEETSVFTLGEKIADVIHVKRTYELKTLENSPSPYLHLKGEGTWKFNTKENTPYSGEWKFELARHIDNVTVRVPYQMQFIYTDPEIIAADRKQAQEQMQQAVQQQSSKAAADLDKLAKPQKAKLVRRFAPIGTIIVQSVQLTPDGKRALVSTHEGPILIFDAAQNEPIGKLEGLKQNVQFLNVSPDGKLVCGGTLTEVCVWDLESRKIVLQPKIDKFTPSCVTFSADNKRVYFGFGLVHFQVWDLASGKLLKVWQSPHGNTKAIMLSDNGKTLIATDSKELFHYEVSTGKLLKSEPLAPGGGGYYYARLTAEGRRGVFTKNHASLDVISLAEPTKPINIPVRPTPSNHSFAISTDGRRVAVTDQSNKQVVVWDTEKNQLIDQWQVDTIAAQTVALSADGKFLLTCGYHKVLQLWEMTE